MLHSSQQEQAQGHQEEASTYPWSHPISACTEPGDDIHYVVTLKSTTDKRQESTDNLLGIFFLAHNIDNRPFESK